MQFVMYNVYLNLLFFEENSAAIFEELKQLDKNDSRKT